MGILTVNRRAGVPIGAVLVLLIALALPSLAAASPPPAGPYRQNDYAAGNAYNIVPPGQSGFFSAADVAKYELNGSRPPHQIDQNDMYANLVYATPGLEKSQILDYFKDASFGVKPGDVERSYTPECAVIVPPSPNSSHCMDVRIVRDQFGVPHVYGRDRAALMFGLGYATGEDRLFLADVLRHAGRADVSSFVGGANVEQDRDTYANAAYMNDKELLAQYNRADDLYGQEGVQIQEDVGNYVDGMNQWIAETRADPVNKLDALYAATNHPEGPQPWRVEDVIATGALVAGIFGKGGGGELGAATAYQEAREVLGRKRGTLVWKDFLSADDPEAPTTVHGKPFDYRGNPGRKGIAMPDPGSVRQVPVVASSSAASASEQDPAGDLLNGLTDMDAASNALVVSARESSTGHPLAVFGPQTGYFAPQLLMEQDAHAPGGPEGPAIDARGVAFVGTNLYVQLGRGRDYSWSATSAGQDIIDTYAVKLCEPDGSQPTRNSRSYVFNGSCQPMDVLTHTNSWTPNAADNTPPGSETLRVFRTKAGLVEATATINGKPYAYTRLRATYNHEVDSAGSFADWNSPQKVHNAKDWIKSGYKNDLTFNWFYVDDKHVAYYNSGANPKRPPGTPTTFPVKAKPQFMWKDFKPGLNTFKREAIGKHAQVIDQRYLTSWNNKEAHGYRDDGIRGYSSLYRSDPLDRNIKAEIKGPGKMSLTELIDAMEGAGTTDDRGLNVVPWALRVIAKGKGRVRDPELRSAMATMRRWARSGAHRIDHDDSGDYDSAEAVKIMDAWWPLWVRREFKPTLGKQLNETLIGTGHAIHDAPGPIGSAFQNVVYGFVQKDLRSTLGVKVRGAYSRHYCGKGKLAKCKRLLSRTLLRADKKSFADVYGTEGCTLNNGTSASPQMCTDAVNPTDVTAAPVEEFHWINRPTFQQAVTYPDHR